MPVYPRCINFTLYDPLIGRRHYLTLLSSSNWELILQEKLTADRKQFYVYGDSYYNIRPWIHVPILPAVPTENEREFNRTMSSFQVAVENSFKELKQFWTTLNFHQRLKARKEPIGIIYDFHALLWNIRVCSYGSSQVAN